MVPAVIVSLSCLVVLVLAKDECPPDVLITPCRCDKTTIGETVICSNITDLSTLDAVFEKSGDWPIQHFVLDSSTVMYVPAAAVVEKDFRTLAIRSSKMTSFFDAAPDCNLTSISLFDVEFQRGMQWELMTNLGNLHDIVIDMSEFRNDNLIETLPDDMFHGMPHLETIVLNGNRLKHFSESVFGGLSYGVMIVDLLENPITCDCSIRWFVNNKRDLFVQAYCAGPEDKKGQDVTDLQPAWFDYCQHSNTLLNAIQ